MNQELLAKLRLITEEELQLLNGAGQIDRSLYMENASNIINSRKLLSRGKLITVRSHTRFVHFPEHTHDYIEVVYMCAGQTTHIINGEKIVLKEGELLFLPQNARQEIYPAGKEDIAINFIILPEFFDEPIIMIGNEDTLLKKFMVDCLRSNSSDTSYLHFEVSDILPVQNLVEILVWTLLNGAPNKRKINQTTMGLLFLELLNYTDKLVYHNTSEDLTLQVLRYIEEHYVTGSLSELANLLHYDPAWLSREIKRKTGRTYTLLLQEKRMTQAGYLLRNTDLNVDEIALRCGYENISYFHRLFQKHYGMSPRHYRM